MQFDRLIFLILARIDKALQSQINLILHHKAFQQLEASWRSVFSLMYSASNEKNIKILLLSLSFAELERDLALAIEYEQAILFQKIYSQGWDQAGGEPFGLLLADYYFEHSLRCLKTLSEIAASCFALVIASVQSEWFGLDNMAEFKPTTTPHSILQQSHCRQWQQFQQDQSSRFVGLVIPKVLLRKPYATAAFQEITKTSPDFLWGHPCFVYGAMAIKNFKETRWFEGMQGFSDAEGLQGADCVYDHRMPLMMEYGSTWHGLATEVYFTDSTISMLSDLGFIAIKDLTKSRQLVIFYNRPLFKNPLPSETGHLGLHYLLCLCRFAHCLKILLRNKIGKFLTEQQLEQYLQQWLLGYTSEKYHALQNQPLRAVKVNVLEKGWSSVHYFCRVRLQLHTLVEGVFAELQLEID